MLFSLSFAALAGCSDREAPTAIPQVRPTLNVVGADYVVTTTADAGDGSLREAIVAANAAGEAKTIAFDIPASDIGCSAEACTIALASVLPDITNSKGVTIDGGGEKVMISGGGTVRVFVVNLGDLTIRNLTIADGGTSFVLGGGLTNFQGTLTVENSTFVNNTGSSGGAISNYYGNTTIRNSTFSSNTAGVDFGGAIDVSGGTVTVSNSTFFGNRGRLGGAIFAQFFSTVTVENSTFFDNTVGGYAAAGAAIVVGQATVSLRNTIVAGSTGASNCSGGITDDGYNLADDASCGFSAVNNSQPGTDPLLDSEGLQNNGGPTGTIALLAGSPAINVIPNGTNGCGTTIARDQRGVSRPQEARCDIGAYEVESVDATPPVITPQIGGTLGNGDWYTTDVTVSWTITDAESDVSSPACTPTTISADTPGQTVRCGATSAGGSSTNSVTVKRDATGPSLAPNVSPNPVLLNESATAEPDASDAMSGVASSGCAAPATSSVGSQSVTCTATDDAGNTTTATASYSVIYPFTEFVKPVSNLPAVNSAHAGSAVPVKFALGGNQGLAIMAAGSPASQQVSCTAGSILTEVETTATTGNSSLSYDAAANQYGYMWRTERSWAGTCRTLTLTFIDGTSHVLSFRFK